MKFANILKIFSIVVAFECFANAFGIYWLQFFSKPSLMLILLTYFLSSARAFPRLKFLITAALAFSWLGDVLLLIEKQNRFLFVYGLIAFLGAHVCYVVYFWLAGHLNREKYGLNMPLLLVVVAYSIIFYLILFPFLGPLRGPVLIYSSVISLMLITGLNAYNSKESSFAKLCIAGTLLFVFSDSILAINRFVFPLPLGSVLVMLTYAFGQLLITEGVIRNLKHLRTS